MTGFQSDDMLLRVLQQRVKPTHLRQRLGIEADREARIFGQGATVFHPENWLGAEVLIRSLMRMTLLHARGKRNALSIRVHRNDVRLGELPPAFEGLTILQLSDLHLDMSEELPQAIGQCVRNLDYDVCVLTGDFRYRTYGPYEPALRGMQRLRSTLKGPVYGVLGNHDTIRLVPALESMDVRMLLNESTTLEQSGARVHLSGIDDPHYYRTDNLEQACAEIPPDEISILLAHSPEIYRHAAHARFDLMLCGHTHGGQIRLPGGIAIIYNAACPRKFCEGSWSYRSMQGYTSLGTGSSIVDLRYNCPPEVTLHRLRRA